MEIVFHKNKLLFYTPKIIYYRKINGKSAPFINLFYFSDSLPFSQHDPAFPT